MSNLAEEIKRKKAMEKDKEAQDQRIPDLEAQVKVLQQQLQEKKSDEEEQRLLDDAKALQKEQAALEEEANLRKVLDDSFHDKQGDAPTGQDLDQKEMISVIADAVGTAIDANSKLVLGKVGDLVKDMDGKIVGTQKAIVELISLQSVKDARSQFEDFDEHKTEIAGILGETRGLSPEDAYILAKGRKAVEIPDKEKIETEKPNQAPGALSRREPSSSADEEKDRVFSSPRKIFKDAVSKAIDKQLATRDK